MRMQYEEEGEERTGGKIMRGKDKEDQGLRNVVVENQEHQRGDLLLSCFVLNQQNSKR